MLESGREKGIDCRGEDCSQEVIISQQNRLKVKREVSCMGICGEFNSKRFTIVKSEEDVTII